MKTESTIGEPEIYSPQTQKKLAASAIANPVLWNSRRYEEQAELYYKYRHYKADIGRWLGRDLIEENGGVNLYVFVGNEPLGEFDIMGVYTHRDSKKPLKKKGGEPEIDRTPRKGSPGKQGARPANSAKYSDAHYCMRSKVFGGSAQQCCYILSADNKSLKLLSTENSVGTPDRVAVSGSEGSGLHFIAYTGHIGHDVTTFKLTKALNGIDGYLIVRKSSQGRGECYAK